MVVVYPLLTVYLIYNPLGAGEYFKSLIELHKLKILLKCVDNIE